jgi:hypothetical protein
MTNQDWLEVHKKQFAEDNALLISSEEELKRLSLARHQLERDVEHYERLMGKLQSAMSPKKAKAEREALGGRQGILSALNLAKIELFQISENYTARGKETKNSKRQIQQLSSRIAEVAHRQTVLHELEVPKQFKASLIEEPTLVGLPWFYRANAEVTFKTNGDIHVYFAKAKGVEDSEHDGHAHYIVHRRKDGSYQRLYERKPALLWPAILSCVYDLFFWAERPSVTRRVIRE